ncbi:hypothetical protein TTHT_0340 [Thermotomaculum hydrothermale]|uniref:Sulfatase N-terminal domain-containing protein n=1 Tax=Thermotomaculum hydrothermale TaxID=981385 RepID=A0A7R6PMR6_9BACT|nr:LTA synthase family protein [Thermotomaculum hydrothermale]BBB31956.1 hypothetical protein TTHT_0340 [Thermotomaculum hydrothermale]
MDNLKQSLQKTKNYILLSVFLFTVFLISYGEFYLYTIWKCPSCISDKAIPILSLQTISLMKFFLIENSLIASFLIVSSLVEKRKLKILLKTIRFILLLIIPVQFVAMYFTGEYIKLQPILQIRYIGFVINLKSLLIFFSTLLIIFLTGYLIDFLAKRYCKNNYMKIIGSLFALNIILIYFTMNNTASIKFKKYYSVNFYPPVREFIKLGYLAFQTKDIYLVKDLTKKEKKLAEDYGFFIHYGKTYPLIKNFVYSSPFPYPKTRDVKRPNIIIFFVESLSAGTLNPYNPTYKDLTPNINNFAKNSMVVKDYYNHTYPTIPGLQGQMASFYPPFNWYDWDITSDDIKLNKLLSIANVLDEKGYYTVYLTHSSGFDTFLKPHILALGFDKTYFEEDSIYDKYRPKNGFPEYCGADDQTVFKVVKNLSNKLAQNQPFLLAVSTIETHSGYNPKKNAKKYPLNPQNRILTQFHNLDYSFGIFWDWFKKSKLKDNTIVILTADHAHNPTIPFNATFGDYVSHSTFDRVCFIIYDPIHKLPEKFDAKTTSIDLAPSLIHLLGFENFKNPWLGLSFFGDRQIFNKSLGLHNTFSLMKLENGEMTVFDETETLEKKQLLDIIHFTQGIYIQNRLWNNNIKINLENDKSKILKLKLEKATSLQ